MKNFFFAALFAVTIVTTAFASGENKISVISLNNFKHDFQNATNVSWSSIQDYAKATFRLNNLQMEVYYDAKGEIIALCKSITIDELPVSAKRAFAKKYDGYTVKEAIKFDGKDEKGYYVKAENEIESVILKVDENDFLSVFKKTKK